MLAAPSNADGIPAQCWSYFNYQIIEASFNITSDILVLTVAIPIFLKLQVPLLQKAILLTIFGLGIFIIAAAILTKLYSLVPSLLTYVYLNWYCRESSVCVYVTNLPAIWSLLLDLFPALRRRGLTAKNHSDSARSRMMRAPTGDDYHLRQFGRLGSSSGTPGIVHSESQEYIVEHAKGSNSGLAINKDITFSVKRDSNSDDDNFRAPRVEKQPDNSDGRYTSNVSAV